MSTDRLEELLISHAPAGTGTGIPRQLPASVVGFTGRAAELAALTRILDEASADGASGTVVISAIGGTAGVGKTALAIQWAHQVAHRFPDGQLYMNLRGYDPDQPVPPADALAGFLRGLGVAGPDVPPEEDERAARYRSLLAGQRTLVVLDNASSAEQVRPLLPGSPSCAVVVTSRDSLAGLVARDGAVRLDLGLLPLADVVRLLRGLIGDRAAADPAATEALAQRCCCLPLALRVAAELAIERPDTPLGELAGELADQQGRLDLLAAGGDPRTGVREVFSWSYRFLDDDAARTFRLAGLHPAADFDAYAAAALSGSDLSQARRVLNTLVRAHLIQPAGPGRYGLHDLLRGYARELAGSHDGAAAEHEALTQLFDHYLHTAATAMNTMNPAEKSRRPQVDRPATPVPPFPDAAAARSWLDGERSVLVSVAQHAAGHGWARHATLLSATLFRYLEHGGHRPEATIIHTSARLAARREGDRAADAAATNALGVIDSHQGRYLQATDKFLEAMDLFRQSGDRLGEARALNNLGACRVGQGRYEEATQAFRQAQTIARDIGDLAGEGIPLANIGFLLARQGHHQEATWALRQALSIHRQSGNRQGECWTLLFLGDSALAQGQYQLAGDLLEQGRAMSRARGYRIHEPIALARIGILCHRQGRHEAAVGHLREAIAVYRELGDRVGEAEVLNLLGEVQLGVGQRSEARDRHTAALVHATESGDRFQQARAHHGLGNASHALGDATEARRHWEQALAIYTDLGVPETAQVRAQLDAAT